MAATVSIAGYDLPEPTTYNATTSTFVDSARNAEGYVIGQVIREDVAKIELTWGYITAEEWSNILMCFSEAHGGSFYNDVTFLNQVTNDYETRQMYVSDRKSGIYRRDETWERTYYKDASLSLVEV